MRHRRDQPSPETTSGERTTGMTNTLSHVSTRLKNRFGVLRKHLSLGLSLMLLTSLYHLQAQNLLPAQQAYLKASNTGARDEFGWSVAISGDTAVIGTHYESSNATG